MYNQNFIGEVIKNKQTKVKVHIVNANINGEEREYVDIRTYASGSNGGFPTPKGITIPLNTIDDLIELLEKTKNELDNKKHQVQPEGGNDDEI